MHSVPFLLGQHSLVYNHSFSLQFAMTNHLHELFVQELIPVISYLNCHAFSAKVSADSRGLAYLLKVKTFSHSYFFLNSSFSFCFSPHSQYKTPGNRDSFLLRQYSLHIVLLEGNETVFLKLIDITLF